MTGKKKKDPGFEVPQWHIEAVQKQVGGQQARPASTGHEADWQVRIGRFMPRRQLNEVSRVLSRVALEHGYRLQLTPPQQRPSGIVYAEGRERLSAFAPADMLDKPEGVSGRDFRAIPADWLERHFPEGGDVLSLPVDSFHLRVHKEQLLYRIGRRDPAWQTLEAEKRICQGEDSSTAGVRRANPVLALVTGEGVGQIDPKTLCADFAGALLQESVQLSLGRPAIAHFVG